MTNENILKDMKELGYSIFDLRIKIGDFLDTIDTMEVDEDDKERTIDSLKKLDNKLCASAYILLGAEMEIRAL